MADVREQEVDIKIVAEMLVERELEASVEAWAVAVAQHHEALTFDLLVTNPGQSVALVLVRVVGAILVADAGHFVVDLRFGDELGIRRLIVVVLQHHLARHHALMADEFAHSLHILLRYEGGAFVVG